MGSIFHGIFVRNVFNSWGFFSRISSWPEVDRLRCFPSLRELRLQHCPILHEYTAHERRMLLVARLPNIRILNGGDLIPPEEREDAERAFIRFHLEAEASGEPVPKRYDYYFYYCFSLSYGQHLK